LFQDDTSSVKWSRVQSSRVESSRYTSSGTKCTLEHTYLPVLSPFRTVTLRLLFWQSIQALNTT
jgi:hypothetical protein